MLLLVLDCTLGPKLGRVIQVSAGIVMFVPYAACCAHCTLYHDNIAWHAVRIALCIMTT